VLAAAFASAQPEGPRIGIIDFYGLRKTPESKVRQALAVREGDPLPRSKGDAEERIDALPGVIESHLEAVCCDRGRMILYVGLDEKGASNFDLREPPDGDVPLPEEVATLYKRFLAASQSAARQGITAEDLTRGHALSADPETRDIQQQFTPIAKYYLPELRHVLRDSSDEELRAIAVYVLGYAPEKTTIVDDLQFALRDADPGVRFNATRGLKAMAVYAHLNSGAHLKVEPTWFIEMLNSLSWQDRNQAMAMLLTLTEDPNPSALEQIRERALPSLVEMAQWKALTHALPAFLLLGRVAGISDLQVHEDWTRGDRKPVIAAATAKKKK
jgi:HEAT repeat protein